MRLRIEAQGRLHIGLISMHRTGARKHGGIGLAVRDPRCVIDLEPSATFHLDDQRERGLREGDRARLAVVVSQAQRQHGLMQSIAVSLSGGAGSHLGLGMGTAISLGILEGLFRLNGRRATAATLVSVSERGGTSGIGINTYFTGGLVMDFGVPQDGIAFRPSSRPGRKPMPTALAAVELPAWGLCLCIPRTIQPKTAQEEEAFFTKATPVSEMNSYEAAYHALFGVYVAALERDFEAFCRAIDAMQGTEWKAQEWQEYGKEIQNIEARLRKFGVQCVGLSSLGPLLYCFGDEDTLSMLAASQDELGCEVVKTIPHCVGRAIVRL